MARLFSWLDDMLGMIEQRQKEAAGERSPADQEKDARTMISLIRVYEKLVELQVRADAKAKARVANGSGRQSGSGEAERLRGELAQRIERLRTQSRPGASAGGAE